VASIAQSPSADPYLDLLKKCLTRSLHGEELHMIEPARGTVGGLLYTPIRKLLAARNCGVFQRVDPAKRAQGDYWPSSAETMLGEDRLDNIESCIRDLLLDEVPGDLIETGVWRGGGTIFMRAVLRAYGAGDRTVWVADSFQGLPAPDPERYAADAGDTHWQWSQLAVSLEQVQANFARYGLLDEQVRFLPGWFRDTLPNAPIDRLALLRVDGDMYESTIDPLRYLYPKLSSGGYVIVDDYSNPELVGCKAAVDDYRAEHGITTPLQQVDWTAVCWRKP
jgi:O-methyltransferase